MVLVFVLGFPAHHRDGYPSTPGTGEYRGSLTPLSPGQATEVHDVVSLLKLGLGLRGDRRPPMLPADHVVSASCFSPTDHAHDETTAHTLRDKGLHQPPESGGVLAQ